MPASQAVITIDGLEIDHVESYDPFSSEHRMSRQETLNGDVNIQSFNLAKKDIIIPISGRLPIADTRTLLTKYKAVGAIYAVTDIWNNEYTAKINQLNLSPLLINLSYVDFTMILWVETYTKVLNQSWA